MSAFFIVCSLLFIIYALVFQKSFTAATLAHAYGMGFLKLFLLGTCGELLKVRIAKHTWRVDKIWQRAFVWGLFGLWFTAAFPVFSDGLEGLAAKGLWPRVGQALSKSLWINYFGGYAWFMMVTHEYCNFLIKHSWKKWSWAAFGAESDWVFMTSFLWKTILFFWIPCHTVTYLLPGVWRVFFAAILSVALGFFLSVGKARKAKQA